MKRIGVLVCAFILVASVAWGRSLPTVEPEKVGLSSEHLQRIAEVFQQEIDQGRLPGAIVLIARKGEVAYFESFGFRDEATNAPMSKDAIFRIYSMTKPLVSVAAMILMEEGRLQLADPVSKFLPEFAQLQVNVPKTDTYGKVTYTLVPAERQITVQDLLRHTAGLAYGEITGNAAVKEAYAAVGVFKPDGLMYEARDVAPAEEVVGLAKAPLVHQPGTVWEYSLAVDVLGRRRACGLAIFSSSVCSRRSAWSTPGSRCLRRTRPDLPSRWPPIRQPAVPTSCSTSPRRPRTTRAGPARCPRRATMRCSRRCC
jgi:CubicO group peptidase (beta-lactamase class C family)